MLYLRVTCSMDHSAETPQPVDDSDAARSDLLGKSSCNQCWINGDATHFSLGLLALGGLSEIDAGNYPLRSRKAISGAIGRSH